MVRICVECDNFFPLPDRDTAMSGVFSSYGECLSGKHKGCLVREEDPACEDFEEEQGGE